MRWSHCSFSWFLHICSSLVTGLPWITSEPVSAIVQQNSTVGVSPTCICGVSEQTMKACSQHINWNELYWPATVSRPSSTTGSLVTRVDVSTWLATAKLGRLVLSQIMWCEHSRWNTRVQYWSSGQFSLLVVNKPWSTLWRTADECSLTRLIFQAV